MVPYSLKVTANKQKLDLVFVFGFQSLDLAVDGVEFTVTTSFDGDLYSKIQKL